MLGIQLLESCNIADGLVEEVGLQNPTVETIVNEVFSQTQRKEDKEFIQFGSVGRLLLNLQ